MIAASAASFPMSFQGKPASPSQPPAGREVEGWWFSSKMFERYLGSLPSIDSWLPTTDSRFQTDGDCGGRGQWRWKWGAGLGLYRGTWGVLQCWGSGNKTLGVWLVSRFPRRGTVCWTRSPVVSRFIVALLLQLWIEQHFAGMGWTETSKHMLDLELK